MTPLSTAVNHLGDSHATRLMPANRRGVAAMEFALIAPIIIAMLLGAFDLGLWVWLVMQLEAALIAAAHYAQEFPEDQTTITYLITSQLPTSITGADGFTVTVPESPGPCPSGTGTCLSLSVSYGFKPLYVNTLTTNSAKYVIQTQ